MKTTYFYIPLQKLGWLYQDLVIDDKRKIRFIDEVKKESHQLKALGLHEALGGRYKTCLILKQEVSKDDTGFEYISEIYKTIAFFRLFLNQDIGFEKVYLLNQVSGEKSECFIQKSSLSSEEKQIINDWRKYTRLYDTKPTVFHWYSRVQGSLPPNERIVFLCVALEGLLLKEQTQELKYRFSLRGAYLLANLPEDRTGLMKFFQQVYDYRSAIVHCDKKREIKLIT